MKYITAFCALLLASWPIQASNLEDGFRAPPDSTKPSCYWYWISDNISREGITRDLEAMRKVGIGEAFIGNIYLDDVKIGNVKALTEEWWGMVEHAVREGGRVGVKVGMFNCPGWSQSGGPWIKPGQAMRYVATVEQRVVGPTNFIGKMAAPNADFQPIALIAFPAPRLDEGSQQPRIDTSVPLEGAQKLIDGNRETATGLPGQAFHIDFEFPAPLTARSLLLVPDRKDFAMDCELAAEQNGKFTTIRKFPLDRSNNAIAVGFVPFAPLTISFPAVTATKFRLSFANIRRSAGLAEIHISGEPRIERYVEKQLGKMHPTPLPMWGDYVWPATSEPGTPSLAVSPNRVLDLSKNIKPDGAIEWQVPAGEWVLLRAGMVPTGIKNAPASPQGQGLEVDKMNRAAAAQHFDAYIGELLRRVPKAERKAFERVIADSYEMGAQNWTDGLRETFQSRYGYDPQPWLPTLTGRIVGSADLSERFLWDLRRLVADQVAYDYVGGLRDACHKHGLKLWLENYGHWGFPAEFLQYGGQSDEVSGEFWSSGDLGSIELRAASSAAHIYGKPLVSAEAFTSGSKFESVPWSLKRRGDWALTEGINHWVLHVYIHQPWEDKLPGVNAWFSTEFNRHNPWFYPGREFIDYYRRCHFLLQQGRHVADVAYFIGEDTPKMTGIREPSLPAGYNFDYINAEVIQSRLKVKNGLFTLPDGMSYRVLVLPPVDTMRPDLLDKISALVRSGGTILGNPPSRSPSMRNHPRADQQVKSLADGLWKECDGKSAKMARVGKGRVFRNMDLEQVFAELKVPPQFACDNKSVLWTQRKEKDTKIFFVCNQSDTGVRIDPAFRSGGKAPELWDPSSKAITRPAAFSMDKEVTRFPFELEPRGSRFVIFRDEAGKQPPVLEVRKSDGTPVEPSTSETSLRAMTLERSSSRGFVANVREPGAYSVKFANGNQRSINVPFVPAPIEINGPWSVSFPPGRDVPESIQLEELISLSEHANPAIQHFSGTATYRHAFEAPAVDKDTRVLLDLGGVEGVAEIELNGKNAGVLWKAPYIMDVTGAFPSGRNELVVRVSGTWRNRLIGDAKFPNGFPDASGGTRRLELKPFVTAGLNLKGNEPLSRFGLLGPVRLSHVKRVRFAGE